MRVTRPPGRLASLVVLVAGCCALHVACAEPNLGGSNDLTTDDLKTPRKNRAPKETAPEGDFELPEPVPAESGRPSESTPTGPDGCIRDADCASSSQICEASKCVVGARTPTKDAGASPQCTKDAECPISSICTAGKCVAGCHDSYDCKLGTLCTAGFCKAGCASDLDCPTTQPSCVTGQCKVATKPACTTDTDCALGTICTAGSCAAGCRDSFDCSLGTICTAGLCKAGCVTSDDCPSTKSCVAGQCKTCTTDAGVCP